ncbi:hypothetical protein Y032_0489g2363 [Ancylostoma ceylanicum]|uniref:Uncharacterized protein n=1 Tax=Ancylostoma ceylanicum TaxID=53326 RepID=A0A016WX49_9BILA|nr:hypothetical protein Y032_0489g2363 [Ancylostoma ceylanicum]
MSCTTGEMVPVQKAVVVNQQMAAVLIQDCVSNHCQLRRQQPQNQGSFAIMVRFGRMLVFRCDEINGTIKSCFTSVSGRNKRMIWPVQASGCEFHQR